MKLYIGLDDTDNLNSRGTGRAARNIAAELSGDYDVTGVIRHQLLVDARVPYTSHNSCAVIMLESPEKIDLDTLFSRVQKQMEADYQIGSDPGLCLASQVPESVIAFGKKAQREVVTQEEARRLAVQCGIRLKGLGGTEDGVIGSLAGIGLAASGNDGRYLQLGNLRSLGGLVSADVLLNNGISSVRTLAEEKVHDGMVLAEKVRPSRRNGEPVLYVTWETDHWLPVKLDQ